jgi:hypothetical protein
MLSADVPTERINRFETCGKHAWVVRSKEDPERYRISSDHCHDRFCLPCANLRSHTIARNVLGACESKVVRFITLTLRANNRPLVDTIARLYACFSRLRTRAIWKRAVTGGVAFLEVKRNESHNTWNVHLHVLCEGRYVAKERLSRTWMAITGDSYIVDIRLVETQDAAVKYVTKYASKPLDRTVTSSVDLLTESIQALKGVRLAITFGTWRGTQLTETLEPEEWEAIAPLADIIEQASRGVPASVAIMVALKDVQSCQPHGPPKPNSPDGTTDGQDLFAFASRRCAPIVPPS